MEAPVVLSDHSEESEMALPMVPSSPPMGSVGLHWGHGACDLLLLSSVDDVPVFPAGDRRRQSAMLTSRVELHVDRFYEDGCLCSCRSFSTPLRVSEASYLTTPQGAAEAAFDVMRLLERNGPPGDALGRVALTLRQYIQDVAAWALQVGVAPLLTEVHGAIYLRMTSEGDGLHHHVEEEEDGDGGEEEATAEQDGRDQLVGDSSSSSSREVTGCGEEEEGEERCAICLEKMAAAVGSTTGGERRCWLPCSHCFHEDCVGRWLQLKAECPLCRHLVASTSFAG